MNMKKTIMLGLAASLMAFPLRDRQDAIPETSDEWDMEFARATAKRKLSHDLTNLEINRMVFYGSKRPEGGYTHTSKKLSKRAKRRNRGKK